MSAFGYRSNERDCWSALLSVCVIWLWAIPKKSFAGVSFVGDVNITKIRNPISEEIKSPECAVIVPICNATVNMEWLNAVPDIYRRFSSPIKKIQLLIHFALFWDGGIGWFDAVRSLVVRVGLKRHFRDGGNDLFDCSNAPSVIAQFDVQKNWLRNIVCSQSGKGNMGWKNESSLIFYHGPELKKQNCCGQYADAYQGLSPTRNNAGPFSDLLIGVGGLGIAWLFVGKSLTCGDDWTYGYGYSWIISFILLIGALYFVLQSIILLVSAASIVNCADNVITARGR